MTDKQRSITGWVAIAITLLLTIYNIVYSSAVQDTKQEMVEKKVQKVEAKAENNEYRLNTHDVTVKTVKDLKADFKEFETKYSKDQKEQHEVNMEILLHLERLNTKMEEMSKDEN